VIADACLAGEEHHLAFAVFCSFPAPPQQFEFFLPTDEGSHAARVQCLEAACYGARPQRRPSPHCLAEPLEIVSGAEVLQLEKIAKKPACAVADDDCVRFGNPLQARREVRGLAYDAALLRVSRANEVADDDHPGRNSDTGPQRRARLERANRCDRFQASLYGSLGIVLMREGIAKIHQNTVAHVSRHESIKPVHSLGDAFLMRKNDPAQVFRVHVGGERRRANQVGEHYRDLAPLGGVQRQRCGRRCNADRGRALLDGFEIGDRAQ